jgi:hypothetical protein
VRAPSGAARFILGKGASRCLVQGASGPRLFLCCFAFQRTQKCKKIKGYKSPIFLKMNSELDDLNTPEYPHWPGNWPGRRFVDLDCVGDPGDWLGLELSSEEEVLTQHPDNDESTAEGLADAYIGEGKERGFPLPADHGVSKEKMREMAVADFVGFIREWRRRAEAAGCFSTEIIAKQKHVSTWGLLPSLGFVADPRVISDWMPGMSCNFGNVKVSASCVMGRYFKEVVLFTGVLQTERTISEICFEMPLYVESLEQCVSWLVYGLDQSADNGIFKPAKAVPWLEEGRKNRNALPWKQQWARESAAYAARPHCFVSKEWARIALKTLAEHLATIADDTPVTFQFDGEVLTIRCAGKVIAVAAQGNLWSQSFSIPAAMLRKFPKRFMETHIEVSIWESALKIGRRCYGEVVAIDEVRNQKREESSAGASL